MKTLAAMFDTRGRAENAIDRLISAKCDRSAITFLPEEELAEIASDGAYDWRQDKWGIWRALSKFPIDDSDRFSFAEGMNRGASVLLVAAKSDEQAERFEAVLSETGAVDLEQREADWRGKGWTGFDGPPSVAQEAKSARGRLVRLW